MSASGTKAKLSASRRTAMAAFGETGSSGLTIHHGQSEVLLKGINVPVAVQKSQAALQASRCDQHVDGTAHRDPKTPEFSVVPRRLDGQVEAAYFDLLQLAKHPLRFVEAPVVLEALQHLCEDQITDHQAFGAKVAVKPFGLRSRLVVEVVESNADIDKNHL